MTGRRVRAFISFDFEHDAHLKGSLLKQSSLDDSPFQIADHSIERIDPEMNWINKARQSIQSCDVFIVLLGRNTHSAPGVLKEARIAKRLRKPRFQIRPQRRTYHAIADAGPTIIWTWGNVKRALDEVVGR